MKSIKKYIPHSLCILLVAGVFYGKTRSALDNQNKSVQIGDMFLYSHEWDTEDPFEEIEIDTVIVVDIRGDYVKWKYKNHPNSSFYLSGKLRFFKHNIRDTGN